MYAVGSNNYQFHFLKHRDNFHPEVFPDILTQVSGSHVSYLNCCR